MCHKQLDGSFSGVPVEESVVLLARSAWFQDWLVEREHVKQLSRSNPGLVPPAPQQPVQRSEQALLQEEWAEEALYGYFESQYDDDDEFEDMYLSRSGPRMVRYPATRGSKLASCCVPSSMYKHMCCRKPEYNLILCAGNWQSTSWSQWLLGSRQKACCTKEAQDEGRKGRGWAKQQGNCLKWQPAGSRRSSCAAKSKARCSRCWRLYVRLCISIRQD